jgi:hypothetical protein
VGTAVPIVSFLEIDDYLGPVRIGIDLPMGMLKVFPMAVGPIMVIRVFHSVYSQIKRKLGQFAS